MAVLEAMASGLPVLSSRLEGIAAALSEEKEGLLAPAGDIAAFSLQLARLTGSADLRQQLGGAARTRVEVSYGAADTARRIEAVYRQEVAIATDATGARKFAQ